MTRTAATTTGYSKLAIRREQRDANNSTTQLEAMMTHSKRGCKRINIMLSCFCALTAISCDLPKELTITASPELVHPGLVSTNGSEIKLTFSPDGKRMLWGTIHWEEGYGGWDIYESVRSEGTWSKPRAVAFNSPYNDFDPFFAPDGSGIYFFSNRPGGLGGDDIYFVSYNVDDGTYGKAAGLGRNINSPGDEWGPVTSPDGLTLMFCPMGEEGKGNMIFLRPVK